MNATDDSHLELWDNVLKSHSWGRYPGEGLIRFMAQTFATAPDRSSIKVLDVGCGPGASLWFLAREGYSIAGIDGSPEAIRRARAWLSDEFTPEENGGFDLHVGNFASLPWADGEFDAVINIEAITSNTLGTIRSCVDEIHRVLKPGGWHYGEMFGTETTGSASGTILPDGTCENPTQGPCKDLGFCNFFDEEKLQSLFSGFSNVALESATRTKDRGKTLIFEWLVSVQK